MGEEIFMISNVPKAISEEKVNQIISFSADLKNVLDILLPQYPLIRKDDLIPIIQCINAQR